MGQGQSCCAYASARSPAPDRAQGNGSGKKNKRRRKSGAQAVQGHAHHSQGLGGDLAKDPNYHNDDPSGGSNGGLGVAASKREGSTGNLQHISEREPDDWKEDPSLHPTTVTMFMEKSKHSIQSKSVHVHGY